MEGISRMKRVLVSLIIVAVVAASVIGEAMALFTD